MKPPLDFYVMTRTYCVYGGHRTLSLIPGFLLIDAPSFGPAISELTVTFHFRTSNPAKHSFEDSFKTFHVERLKLPKVAFRRSREKMEIDVASDLIDGRDCERSRALSLSLFRHGVAETIDALGLMATRLTKKDEFDLDASLNHCRKRQEKLPDSEEALAALEIELKERELAIRAAMSPWERLGIDWRDYHPDARRILDEPFFWEQADDDSPHGNDTGADLLSAYRDWLDDNPRGNPLKFFDNFVADWGFPKNTDDPIFREVYDQAAIALAFAELKLKARCDTSVAKLAMEAVRRQRDRALSAGESDQNQTFDLIEAKLQTHG